VTERQRELHERLSLPEALLSRTDVAELGLPRRASTRCSAHYPSSSCRDTADPWCGLATTATWSRHRLTGTIA
jgi:hypothetical protein